MEKLKYRIQRFMYGRYGFDNLYYALTISCLVLLLLNRSAKLYALNIATYIILIYALYRVFSKNVRKRRLENEKFLKIYIPAKTSLLMTARRIKESGTHRFRRCPGCGSMLRLPRKKGRHIALCPRCGKEFDVDIKF